MPASGAGGVHVRGSEVCGEAQIYATGRRATATHTSHSQRDEDGPRGARAESEKMSESKKIIIKLSHKDRMSLFLTHPR